MLVGWGLSGCHLQLRLSQRGPPGGENWEFIPELFAETVCVDVFNLKARGQNLWPGTNVTGIHGRMRCIPFVKSPMWAQKEGSSSSSDLEAPEGDRILAREKGHRRVAASRNCEWAGAHINTEQEGLERWARGCQGPGDTGECTELGGRAGRGRC